MELLCIKDYSDTKYRLKSGDSTEGLGMSEAYKASILADYPDKFKVVGGSKEVVETELVVETKVPEVTTSQVKFTKKATKA